MIGVLTAGCCRGSDFQGATHLAPFDEDGMAYSKATPESAVTELQRRIDSGAMNLDFDPKFGYLPGVLKELKVPVSSQMLVFSKTSLQRDRISPGNPRAIYFNDDVYLGWIPGAPLIEIAVADPKLGAVFYTLEQKSLERPKFQRNDQCLECHASSKTMGVPGHLARSFATGVDGSVDLSTGISQVNHRTPFEDRWGGWYVSGTHGEQLHRGNLAGQPDPRKHAGNCTNLGQYFSTEKYSAEHSDIIALMVLEHQLHMHNFITRLNVDATMMLKTYGHANYLRSIVDGFVRYLLFAEEAPLRAEVIGTSAFRGEFEAPGIKDRQGRSLRQFDLRTRMFKFPCSYLIYSEAFDALPNEAKEKVYERLFAVLSGKDQSEAYENLTAESRRAILEILRETKKGLPDYWND